MAEGWVTLTLLEDQEGSKTLSKALSVNTVTKKNKEQKNPYPKINSHQYH